MKVGITGGIGSGKSYVCRCLEARGIAVYDCDREAKRLMRSSAEIRRGLIALVGPDAYLGDELNKRALAEFLLQSEEHAQAVDDIVHPVVARDFERSGLDWLESAILFSARFDRRTHIDFVVCVSAPEEVRIGRVMKRDGIGREKVLEWMNRQLPQEEVVRMSHFEVVNDGVRDIDSQIDRLLERLRELAARE